MYLHECSPWSNVFVLAGVVTSPRACSDYHAIVWTFQTVLAVHIIFLTIFVARDFCLNMTKYLFCYNAAVLCSCAYTLLEVLMAFKRVKWLFWDTPHVPVLTIAIHINVSLICSSIGFFSNLSSTLLVTHSHTPLLILKVNRNTMVGTSHRSMVSMKWTTAHLENVDVPVIAPIILHNTETESIPSALPSSFPAIPMTNLRMSLSWACAPYVTYLHMYLSMSLISTVSCMSMLEFRTAMTLVPLLFHQRLFRLGISSSLYFLSVLALYSSILTMLDSWRFLG